MVSLKSQRGDKALKEFQIPGLMWNLASLKKVEIHVFDTGLLVGKAFKGIRREDLLKFTLEEISTETERKFDLTDGDYRGI